MVSFMNAEIIAIGSELLLGQLVDTNTSSIAKHLAENGLELVQATAVGDDLDRIKKVVQEASRRSAIIITTGGIGPTEDDLTREAVAEVFDRPLEFQPHLMEQIEALFKRRGFRMSENNRKQACIPRGALPIENPKGTAPGFIVEYPGGVLISLPGVPFEMEYLMTTSVLPYLRRRFQLKQQIIKYKVLRACGLGESAIGLQIKDLMQRDQNPSVGTLASIGDIRIRITAKADSPAEASRLIEEMERKIRERLGVLIYGVDEETLQGKVTHELERKDLTLSLVETFTGGILAQKLVHAGSRALIAGFVLPVERSLLDFLDISTDEFTSLQQNPQALSDRLAMKVRERAKTTIGLSEFGKVVESPGEGEFRIETFYSLSTEEGTRGLHHTLGGELWMVRERASIIALDMLRKYLLGLMPRE